MAALVWNPPAPTLVLPGAFPDSFEVLVFQSEGGTRLVAAIELVSPGNKDRAEARRAFVIKCAAYLQRGIGLIVVDIVTARQRGRALAAALGFSGSDLTVIATAISELARNIIEYATTGEIVLSQDDSDGRPGIVIVARDEGPGIPDVSRALSAGYSTGPGLGLGLPGVRRLMDDFEITSDTGHGTTVAVRKWLP